MVELIVVFSIIGFIVIAELIILNNKVNEYANPYYAAYNALKKASYNVLADMYCPDPNSSDPECRKGPREFPTTSRGLCNRVAEFINTSENYCNSADSVEINDEATNIDNEHPHFISSNSYRFWFGGMRKIQVPNAMGGVDELEYFVTYVDINGEKRPNRITCDGPRILPDIVPFAITRRGEVVPMGLPVFSKTYLTAKIKYPVDITNADDMKSKQSPSLSFYEAIYGAWPATDPMDKNVFRYIDIPFSIVFAEDPLYLNSNINQCLDGMDPDLLDSNAYKAEAIPRTVKGCVGGTYSCQVVIDSSAGTRF